MRQMILAVLAFLIVPLGTARSTMFQAPPPTERVPNTITENVYPRWLWWTAMEPEIGPTGWTNAGVTDASVAVDSRNFAHMALATNASDGGTLFVPDGFQIQIVYKNDHIEERRANGLSGRIALDTTQAWNSQPNPPHKQYVSAPDICVDSNDNVHVVWIHMYLWHNTYVNTSTLGDPWALVETDDHWEVMYCKKTSTGWGAVQTLTPSGVKKVKYGKPRVAVGPDGVAHVVAERYDFNVAGADLNPPRANGSVARPASSSIRHFVVGGGNQNVSLPWALAGGEPRLVSDGTSRLHLVWTEAHYIESLGSPADYTQTCYSSYLGGWGGKTVFGGSSPGMGSRAPDVAIDPVTNAPHVVYSYGTAYATSGTLMYSAGVGSGAAVSAVPATGSGAVAVDSRNQIHVMWRSGGALRYAARVRNPDPNIVSSTWRYQDPAIPTTSTASASSSIRKVALSKNDQIHLVTERYYTKSLEYGVGTRDGAAMVGMFPGGALNTTSGNLAYSLGLFGSTGAGPSTNLSLVYNSLDPYAGGIAPGWKFNYDMYLVDHLLVSDNYAGIPTVQPDDAVTLFLGDGRPILFRFVKFSETDMTQQFYAADDEYGFFSKLEKIQLGGALKEYRLTTKHGTIYYFDIVGRLMLIQDPDGNQLQVSYAVFLNGNGVYVRVLYAITDMIGNAWATRPSTVMSYELETDKRFPPRPLTIWDPTGRVYQFTYLGNQLETVKFTSTPGTPTHTFEYSTANNTGTKERINQLRRYVPPRGTVANPKYGWTCHYNPDGRLTKVEDPEEVYLLFGDSDQTPASPHVAEIMATYDETINVMDPREVMIVDRRGAQTKFVVEPRRALAKVIWGCDALLGIANIVPTIRTFDQYGNLTELRDRWNNTTQFVYHPTSWPLNVRDNLKEVWRPFATGGGVQLVQSFTYTIDGFNNIHERSEYVMPTEGTVVEERKTTHEYNTFGQLTKITHPDVTRPDNVQQNNVFRTMEYDGPRRQLTKIIDEEGHWTTFSDFDSRQGLAQSVLRQGGTQPEQFIHHMMGQLAARNRPWGGPMNDNPGSTSYLRDGLYRVTQVIDPKGKITNYGYDLDSNLISVTPPVGGQTTTTFDRRGFASSGTTPDGNWSQWVDASGNLRRTRDYRNFETNWTHDVMNRVIETRAPGGTSMTGGGGGGGPAIHTTQLTYDVWDGLYRSTLLTEVGSPANRITRTYMDRRGRTVRTLAPDGFTESATAYNQLDQPVAQMLFHSSILQSCTVVFRDARHRVDRVRTQSVLYGAAPDPMEVSSIYTIYNKTGAVVQTVDPLGTVTSPLYANKTTYVRDARDRVFQVIDGKGVIVRENYYGDDDLLAEVMVPDPVTKSLNTVRAMRYGYTSRKELRVALNARDEGVQYTYGDLQGQLTQTLDSLGRVNRQLYDTPTQRPSETIVADGTTDQASTRYTWVNGMMTETRVFNPDSQLDNATYAHTYDAAGRLERIDYPAPGGGSTPMSPERRYFDDFGQPQQSVTGGRTVNHTFNPLGQLTNRTWSGTTGGSEIRTYNGAGLPTAVTSGNKTVSNTWNAWNGTPVDETFSVNGSGWKMQTRDVDRAGNLKSLTDGEGQVHGWPVDENNRPVEKKLGPQGVSQIFYTPGGLVDYEILKDAGGSSIARTTHTYDNVSRRVRSVTITLATGEVQSDFVYEYNAMSEVTKVTPNHLATNFTTSNDLRGRLILHTTSGNAGGTTVPEFNNVLGGPPTGNESVASGEAKATPRTLLPVPSRIASYVYDRAGNRTSQTINGVTTTFQYNALSQLKTETSPGQTVTHQYDELGNETSRVTSISGGGTTTEAYGYNHLNMMSAYTNTTTGAMWQYDFWPEGDRYAKSNLATGNSELYVPADGDVVTEYTKIGAGNPLLANTYLQGLGIDSKVMRLQAGTLARRFYLGDSVGTVTGTLNEQGTAAELMVRDAWGQTIAGASSERYGFAQRELDGESGLVFMRNRMYDSRTGRFTQTDPLVGNRPFDHYAYASNNPISRIDPMGLQDRSSLQEVNDFNIKNKKPIITEDEWARMNDKTIKASQRIKPGDGKMQGTIIVIDSTKGPKVETTALDELAGRVTEHQMQDGIKVTTIKGWGLVAVEEGASELLGLVLMGPAGPAANAARRTGRIVSKATQHADDVARVANKAAAGSVDLMKGSDDFLKNAAKRVDVDPNGVLDVVAHGDNKSIEIPWGGNNVDVTHRVLADMLKHNPQYQRQPIRLLSCHTGAGADSFGQNLANKLKVDVYAPNKYVWAEADGTIYVAGGKTVQGKLVPDLSDMGKFEKFSPKKTQ